MLFIPIYRFIYDRRTDNRLYYSVATYNKIYHREIYIGTLNKKNTINLKAYLQHLCHAVDSSSSLYLYVLNAVNFSTSLFFFFIYLT